MIERAESGIGHPDQTDCLDRGHRERERKQQGLAMGEEQEMVAGTSQRTILSKALQELAAKDHARFEDYLWIIFGDEWMIFLHNLERRRLIKYIQTDDHYAITDEGRRVLGVLRRAGHGIEDSQHQHSDNARRA